MLWSATVTKGKPYAVTLPFNLRISHACLTGSIKDGKRYYLLCTYDNLLEEEDTTATICSLGAGEHENRTIDLCIDGGEEVTFSTSGEASINLTGYFMPEEDFDSDDFDSDSDSDSDAESEDGINTVLEALARAEGSSDDEGEDDDDRRVKDVTNGDDSEEDSEDDSDEEMEEFDSSSGEDVQEYDDVEKKIADSILQKVREKAERVAKQKPAKITGQKRKAAESPADSQKAKKQKVATPTKKEAAKPAKPATPTKRTLAGGLVVETVKEGRGTDSVKKGRKATVKYSGRLKNGKQFDSGVFSFRVGAGEVIKGWDLGVPGMKVGEKRKLIIPSKLGYGKAGSGPIPKNATLYFDVEMIKF